MARKTRIFGPALLALTLALSPDARADRGGLTLGVGGGGALQQVATPYAAGGTKATMGFTPSLELEARYAVAHWLEVGGRGLFDFPATYYHNNTIVQTRGTSYPGTLRHDYWQYGAFATVRGLLGIKWRPFVELGVGWLHRSVDKPTHIDDSNPAFPQDYYLGLSAYTRDNLGVMGSVGLLWTGDKVWVSLAPRMELALGLESTWNVVIPLTVGWTFYL